MAKVSRDDIADVAREDIERGGHAESEVVARRRGGGVNKTKREVARDQLKLDEDARRELRALLGSTVAYLVKILATLPAEPGPRAAQIAATAAVVHSRVLTWISVQAGRMRGELGTWDAVQEWETQRDLVQQRQEWLGEIKDALTTGELNGERLSPADADGLARRGFWLQAWLRLFRLGEQPSGSGAYRDTRLRMGRLLPDRGEIESMLARAIDHRPRGRPREALRVGGSAQLSPKSRARLQQQSTARSLVCAVLERAGVPSAELNRVGAGGRRDESRRRDGSLARFVAGLPDEEG